MMLSKFCDGCSKPIIEVKIGGLMFKALVDSGADFTMLRIEDTTLSLLEMRGIIKKTGGFHKISGAVSFGDIKCDTYAISQLIIGNITLNNVETDVLDNPHPECDLYLGLNILEKFNYTIDNKNKQVNMELI